MTEVVDQVARGASVVVTRGGAPVAELRPISKPPLGREALLARGRRLRPVDPIALRRDLDRAVDPAL